MDSGLSGGGVAREKLLKEIKSPHDTGLFETMADSLPALVWISDLSKGCVWFNRQWLEFTGRTLEEEYGDGWASGVHPDDLDRCLAIYVGNFEKRTPFEMEYRLRHHSGEYRWLLDRGSPRFGPDGEFVGFTGACIDINDRKQLAEEHACFFGVASDILVVSDPEGHFRKVNPACEQILGWTPEEMQARPWRDFVHPDDLEMTKAEAVANFAGKEVLAFENRYRHKDGSYRWLSWRARLNRDQNVVYASAVDVTQRKETETKLNETLERYYLAINGTSDGIWDWNVTTNEVYFSPRFKEMVGYRDDEMASDVQEWSSRLHPEDRDATWQAVNAYLSGEADSYGVAFRMRHKDGSWRWILSRAVALRDAHGRPYRMSGAHTDITELKNLEHKLRESEQRFRRMADAAPAILWTSEPDGICNFLSQGWYAFTGQTESEARGYGWMEAVHPHDRDALNKTFLTANARREPFSFDYRLRSSTGEYRWTLDRGQPRFDTDGTFLGYVGSVIDIHERKQMEDALTESESRFRLLADNVPVLIWITDADGAEFVNKGYLDYLGKPQNEILGMGWTAHLHPEDTERYLTDYRQAFASQTPFSSTFRFRRHDGAYRWFNSVGSPRHAVDGTFLGYIGSSMEITQIKELEQELVEARDKAEAASVAKSEFLANMSHEIRTPMNAVVGLANLLSLSKPLTPKQHEFVKTLQLSADALLSLINDLLDIAKIESRSVELERTPFRLDQLMEGITSIMAVRAKEKDLAFSFEGECAKGRTYLGDPTRIRQVIMNLCSNAVKFTEAGGVQVGIECLPHNVNPEAEVLCITVEDTGIGIAPEKQATVFEKFVQADSSITRKYGGSGLGLAITKTLTEIMGGQIKLQSEPGKGSKFTICLPLLVEKNDMVPLPQQPVQALPSTRPEKAGKRPRILLVEDHAANILVAETFLKQFGYDCDVANDGREAVAKACNGEYALALMDVQMPGMNGFEATRLIRADEQRKASRPLRIIGMTAHALTGDRERCLAAGMDDYLSKPFDPKELEAKVAAFAV